MIHCSLLLTFLAPLVCASFLAIKSIFRKTQTSEAFVSQFSQIGFLFYLAGAILTSISWISLGSVPYRYHLNYFLNFYLDLPGIVYLCVTAIIANIILFYSKRYLHRDPGYRRFYMILSAFITGLTLVICAGTFDLIFAGWEIVGLSSFLLIGFYWHRPQAALNANRAYFIYRICDLGLLASALISHLVWHNQDVFFELSHGIWHTHWREIGLAEQWALCFMILLPVLGKSAQFPFCYWLPRAMEGPTPSSAIFYGALSIHAGVFLLMRTFSIWFNTPGFVWVVGGIGLFTAIFATLCGRVQSNIKGQIGYASIAQVGIMLIELSLGLTILALIHMTANAFLRCFQLLISPSIVAQQLQIHNALMGQPIVQRQSSSHRSSLYLFAINEGYLPDFIHWAVVKPIHMFSQRVNQRAWIAAPALMGTTALLAPLPYVVLGVSVFLCFTALGETKSPFRVLNIATLSNILVAVAIWFEHRTAILSVLLYLVGLSISWLLATDALRKISKHCSIETLSHFSGLFAKMPHSGSLFLLGLLGLIGFPLASTFWSEDHLIEHALSSGWIFLIVFNGIFVFNGITLIRLYSTLFWGKREHESPDTSFDFSSHQVFARVLLFLLANAFLTMNILG